MTYISTREMLASPVVTRVIRTLATPDSYFQNFFGLGPDSSNIQDISGHDCSWDIFETTRSLALYRAPGTGPAARQPYPIGNVRCTIPRAHMKLPLLDEQIFRLRRLGQGPDQVDRQGQSYVLRQQTNMSQEFKNSREFLIRCLLKGTMGLLLSGDGWIPVAGGSGTFDVDFQVPAGNKNQLDMLGAGDIIGTTWSNAAADIPTDCIQVNTAFKQLHGRPLRHAFISSSTFQAYVMTNTAVKAAAGTANRVWQSWGPSRYVNSDGQRDAGFEVVLNALPWLTWHLYDSVLTVNGTSTQLVTDNHVHFLPDPDPSWIGGFHGSEIVRENKLSSGEERFGMQAWSEAVTQPSGFELIGVDNFMPALYVPKCVTDSTVVF